MKKKEENIELQEEQQELDTKLNEEMLKLEEEINILTDQNKGLEEKVKLAQAELINYRRRKDEETEGLLKYANQGIITSLLPIIDNFERFLSHSEDSEELKKYSVGIKMIYNNFTRRYDFSFDYRLFYFSFCAFT